MKAEVFTQRGIPYSIAQMPVPVPKSSTRVGWSIGASASLPLNSRVQIWCCRSTRTATDQYGVVPVSTGLGIDIPRRDCSSCKGGGCQQPNDARGNT